MIAWTWTEGALTIAVFLLAIALWRTQRQIDRVIRWQGDRWLGQIRWNQAVQNRQASFDHELDRQATEIRKRQRLEGEGRGPTFE